MSSMTAPQISIRHASERGHFNFGWLDTWHSFSFGDYHDPQWMGFRSLRVLNDDRVAGGSGFPMHPHRDMEIITYMLAGELSHQDSMGNRGTIKEHEVQYMCAGNGIMHSEANKADGEAHFLQIWIRPPVTGLLPGYGQAFLDAESKHNQLCIVAGVDGSHAPITTHQDIRLYASLLDPAHTLRCSLPAGRYGWLQVARGSLSLNGLALEAGDGAVIDANPAATTALDISSTSGAEMLLFDLA